MKRTGWHIVRRSVLGTLCLVIWLALLGASNVFTGLVSSAACGLGACVFVFVAMCGLAGWLHFDDLTEPAETLSVLAFLAGLVAVVTGLGIGIGFGSWYLIHYGVVTQAIVAEAHCFEGRAEDCEQRIRVTSSATERDLGWVGCNGTGHWTPGASIEVRADPRGWVPPDVSSCDGESGFGNAMMLIAAVDGVAGFAIAAAVPIVDARTRRKDLPPDDEPDR